MTLTAEMMEGSWVVRLQWLVLFGVAMLLLRSAPAQNLTRHMAGNPLLIVLIAYCAASALWSAFPSIVLKRIIQFVGVLLIGMAVAHYHGHRFDKLLSFTLVSFALLLGLSIVFAVAVPSIGIETAVGIEGAWRGILSQKNQLGIFSAVSIYFTVVCFIRRSIGAYFAGLLLVLALICLVMSRSSSSATVVAISLFVYFVLHKPHIRSFAPVLRLVIAVGFVVFTINLAYFFAESKFPSTSTLLAPFAAIFGKSSDLTGRSDIWELMWNTIELHPYIGLGFTSFWLGPGGPSQFISDVLRWSVPSAHNGYLEILNELGWIGMAFFVLTMAWHAANLIKLFRIKRDIAAFHAGLLLIYFVSNFSESTALRVLSFLQLLMFFSMVLTVQSLHERTAANPGQ